MTASDLDALEKLADEASMARGLWDEIHCLNKFHDHADPATIKALIAELREARGHLSRCVELVPEPGAIDAADAFNGKGEG
ncbi:MAG: hypothetical protein DI624_04210 [Brevundimonas sp.]|uniref:hypothetical protein n=1 Tax=Brevundimonas sp. TaxID=1871086 RepID=UPI000DB1CCC0|nr:hypothetical protein [Brevundimonas sp.]PZT99883.1 MAG: hypothetical protein DI624_04210 [Brevundimonas sp.]